MIEEIKIKDDPRLIECGGKMLCEIIGGSKLYGLSTPTSDTDYRGLFVAGNPLYRARLKSIKSIVQLEKETGRDATYYEIHHFMKLMAETNTQVMEILYAPQSAFVSTSFTMASLQAHREELMDSERLKKSLIGYSLQELRLATGERSGELGSKRKAAVEKYGFSPKNFVQIFRLLFVGRTLFTDDIFPVDLKSFNPDFCAELLDIKTNPQNYTKEDLVARFERDLAETRKVFDDSLVKHEFDWDLAADLVIAAQR